MGYRADVMWGVVVDENKYKTRVLEDGRIARIYKITGTKALKIDSLELVDTGIKAFDKYVRIHDRSSYLNHYAIAVLDKNGDYIGGFICKYSSLERSLKNIYISGTLLIYGQSNNLLYGDRESCAYICESAFTCLNTTIEFDLLAESVEIRFYNAKTDMENLKYLINCAMSFTEAKSHFTEDNSIFINVNLYYISKLKSKSVILPESCKYLIVDEDCEIESIVFNKGIERVSDKIGFVSDIDTYYISREVSKEFMGNLLYILLYDSIVEEWDIKRLRKEAYYMFHGGKLAEIYDLCNKEENKIIMNSVLGDKTIVVY